MKKRYQVFISSTYKDLIEERAEVLKTLLKTDCIPAGMELFPASDESQWKIIQKVIDESDLYVVILAGKYGSEYKGKSYTQREYEYALVKNKPIVGLIHKEPDELPAKKSESNPEKIKKLDAFRATVQKKTCDFWTTKGELTTALYHSITSFRSSRKSDGWIRATRYNLKKLSDRRNSNLLKEISGLNRAVESRDDKIRDQEELIQKLKGKAPQKDLKEALKEKVEDIDRTINELFPGKLHSDRIKGSLDFSTQKLTNSLTSMGIPIEACLEVIELMVPELISLKRQVTQFSTSHIRRAVANALYRLDTGVFTEEEIQYWGDSYVRKYGNPENRTLVLYDNGEKAGSIEPLTYRILRKEVFPELISSILGESKTEKVLKSLRKKEDARIAEELMQAIKQLNVYRIHYSTILSLARDIALQPPHPWLVDKPFDLETIAYDFERSTYHCSKVQAMLLSRSIEEGAYSMRECLHHSCSGILSLYGVFMGCGYLSPFYNLVFHTQQLLDKKSQETFSYTSFNDFPKDLLDSKLDINLFYQSLVSLKMNVTRSDDNWTESYEILCSDILKVYGVFFALFRNYYPNESNHIYRSANTANKAMEITDTLAGIRISS